MLAGEGQQTVIKRFNFKKVHKLQARSLGGRTDHSFPSQGFSEFSILPSFVRDCYSEIHLDQETLKCYLHHLLEAFNNREN